MTDENTKSEHEEYGQIEQERRAWAQGNTSRDQLLLPLAVAIFAFLGSQLPQFVRLGIAPFALTAGALLLAALLSTWRGICLYTDRQIVRLYRQEVILERQLGFSARSRYIYSNLSGRSRELLAKKTGIPLRTLNKGDYEEFVDELKRQSCSCDAQECLAKVLEEHGYGSVSTRGQFVWNWAALTLFVLWVVMAVVFLVWWQPVDP